MTQLAVPTGELVVKATTSALRGGDICEQLQVRTEELVTERLTSALAPLSDLLPDTDTALDVLLQASDRGTVLRHPSFRYLIAGIRRAWRTDADALLAFATDGLSAFAWPRQLRDSLSGSWSTHLDEDGGLRLGALGRYLEFGPRYAKRELSIELAQGGATIRIAEDGLTVEVVPSDIEGGDGLAEPPTIDDHGFAISSAPKIDDVGPEVSARDPWLRPSISGTNQRRDGIEFFGSTWSDYDPSPDVAGFAAGFKVVQDLWPEAAQECAQFVSTLVPLTSAEKGHRAFTVLSRQGAIFVSSAPAHATAEMILHETAHVKLREMQMLDPILVNPLDDSVRIDVPWRPDPRPLPGVLEGVFVFCHVAELQMRLRRLGLDDLSPRAGERITHLAVAYEAILERAELTEIGLDVMAAAGEWIADLQGRPS